MYARLGLAMFLKLSSITCTAHCQTSQVLVSNVSWLIENVNLSKDFIITIILINNINIINLNILIIMPAMRFC